VQKRERGEVFLRGEWEEGDKKLPILLKHQNTKSQLRRKKGWLAGRATAIPPNKRHKGVEEK